MNIKIGKKSAQSPLSIDLSLPFLDNSILSRLLDEIGDKECINELISRFIVEVNKRIKDIQWALQNPDFERVALEAHTIKSTCATLGAYRLQEFARQLEKTAKDHDQATASDLLNNVEHCVKETERSFEQL
jgi:HPt (histidine-containing phosphotransfer) domain-containing protein